MLRWIVIGIMLLKWEITRHMGWTNPSEIFGNLRTFANQTGGRNWFFTDGLLLQLVRWPLDDWFRQSYCTSQIDLKWTFPGRPTTNKGLETAPRGFYKVYNLSCTFTSLRGKHVQLISAYLMRDTTIAQWKHATSGVFSIPKKLCCWLMGTARQCPSKIT